ncbi:hypothetical protein KK062_27850 [Fulvivirgaceae bacterium PWU5]|uniref:Uncharacterized protein n=1 Tax=Dawidia cretensis TaxID=2782350 RepID=A0AAP2E5B3_9BACT|nr:Ig-like domain-containing protein [Dawidia cretensis]MBT1712087.1 hypothetical protein [Dawidia cretensis]
MTLIKKTPPLRRFFTLACTTLALLSACSDDDSEQEPVDTDLPTVTITGLQADAIVWNTVTITVAADDNEALQQVEVQLDNTTVATETDKSFTYELNTNDLPEGRHTLTLIATDAAGNTKTQYYTFIVRNTLISIDVPENFLGADKKGFVFLSDNTGNVIVSREYENGDTLRIRSSAFNGSEFHLTEVYVDEGDNYQELRTYTHIQRGGTWAPRPGNVQFGVTPPPAGTAYLSFNNALPDITYVVASDVEGTFVQDGLLTAALFLQRDDAKLYITRSENDPDGSMTHYLLTPPVAIGEEANNATIDLGQVSNPLTIVNADVSAYDFSDGNLHITGLVTAGDYLNKYWIADSYLGEDGHVHYRYPGEAFGAYYSRADFYGDGYAIHNYVNGLPDFEPLNCAIDVAINGNSLIGTITGDDIDFTEFRLGYDANTEWYIFTAAGTIDVTLPALPANVLDYVSLETTGLTVSAAAIHSFDFNGYDGFLEYIRETDYGSHFAENFGAAYKRYDRDLFPASEGRIRHPRERAQARSKR